MIDLSALLARVEAKKVALSEAKGSYAAAEKPPVPTVRTLDARLKILEKLLGLEEK